MKKPLWNGSSFQQPAPITVLEYLEMTLFQQWGPPPPLPSMVSCFDSLLSHTWESLCFIEFRILQHQVHSPHGPRRRLPSTKPSPIKNTVPPPPQVRVPGNPWQENRDNLSAAHACGGPRWREFYIGVCLGSIILSRLSLLQSF